MHRIINPQNKTDEICFTWCHLIHFTVMREINVGRHKNRNTALKKHIHKVDYTGIEFPVTLKQVSKIEDMNQVRINVYEHHYERNLRNTTPVFISEKNVSDEYSDFHIREELQR